MDFNYVIFPAIILVAGTLVNYLSIRRILTLPVKVTRKWRRVAERIILSGVILFAAVMAGSATYNAVALHIFRAHNPPPGEIYAVDGHKMHLYCIGSGSPTIVLDAGLGSDALTWGGVQPVLARTTRVCAYDRAGYGWSDPLSAPSDADHIATELHGLLQAADITGPIVLMGHSIAGIYIRDYASHYPADVAGLIFVDGSTPLQDRIFKTPQMKPPLKWVMMLLTRAVYGAVFSAGIPRLMGGCTHSIPGFDAHAAKLATEDGCHGQVAPILAENDSMDRSGEETVHTGPYGALPILIFSEDPKRPKGMSAAMANSWNQMQEDLKKLSSHSRRIIAKNSSHSIYIDRWDLIEKEVPIFIEQIRGTIPQPTNFGTTITE